MNTIRELDRYRYMARSTFRRGGAEVTTPVWFAAADGNLYVFTAGDSSKVTHRGPDGQGRERRAALLSARARAGCMTCDISEALCSA